MGLRVLASGTHRSAHALVSTAVSIVVGGVYTHARVTKDAYLGTYRSIGIYIYMYVVYTAYVWCVRGIVSAAGWVF